MLVVTEPKDATDGEAPKVIHYVTDSGYTEVQDARSYVGRKDPTPQSLLLLDLDQHTSYPLDLAALPGIKDDPLKAIRAKTVAALEKAGKTDEAKALKAPDERADPHRLRRERRQRWRHRLERGRFQRGDPAARRSTTRTAGWPASISPGTRWSTRSACTTTPGSTGTSTISAGSTTTARCGT